MEDTFYNLSMDIHKLIWLHRNSLNTNLTITTSKFSSTMEGPNGSVIGTACTSKSGLIDCMLVQTNINQSLLRKNALFV